MQLKRTRDVLMRLMGNKNACCELSIAACILYFCTLNGVVGLGERRASDSEQSSFIFIIRSGWRRRGGGGALLYFGIGT